MSTRPIHHRTGHARLRSPHTTPSIRILATSLVMALGGCASMEPEQCRVADWFRVGQSDGARGDPERVSAYTEDCLKVGTRPDPGRYRQGWDIGIRSYCTPQNGWRSGTQGQYSKSDVCRGQQADAAYRHYFQAGMLVYQTNERMRSNSNESYRLERQLDKAANDGERRSLRDRLRSIDREQSDLRFQLSRQQSLAP